MTPNELRIFLHREFVHDANACRWALRDSHGHILASGEGLQGLQDLPPHRLCHIVLDDSLISSFQVPLPPLPARKLLALLPAALEGLTLTPVDQLHLALIETGTATTPATLWAIEAAWLSQALERLQQHGCTPAAILPEVMLTPWSAHTWTALQSATGTVLRLTQRHAIPLAFDDPSQGLNALAKPAPQSILHLQAATLPPPNLTGWNAIAPTTAASAWDWRTPVWGLDAHLLQGRFTPAAARIDWTALARRVGFGVAILLALQVTGGSLYWAKLEAEAASLDRETRVLAQRVLPSGAQIVHPARQVETLWRQQRAAAGQEAHDALLATLAALGTQWPSEAEPLTLSWGSDGLRLTAHQRATRQIDALALQRPDLHIEKQAGSDADLVEFRVKHLSPQEGH